MQTILEYLKRRERQYYTAEKVSVYYDDGIEIHDKSNGQKHDFVIMAFERLSHCTYNAAEDYAKRNGCRLPTKDEWKVIIDNIPHITQILTDLHAPTLFKPFYWCESHFGPTYIEPTLGNEYLGDDKTKCACIIVKDI